MKGSQLLCVLCLQVAWDEPDLLQNVKRVNPWLVELVSTMPTGHLGRFSPPRKRARLPYQPEFPFGQLPVSPSSPLCCLPNDICVQGARHARFDLSSSPLHFQKMQPFDFKMLDHPTPLQNPDYDALSCSLKMGISKDVSKKNISAKTPMFVLFGQPILTAEQISSSQETEANSDGNRSAVIQSFPTEGSSDGEFPRFKDGKLDLGLGTGHCKVFVESEDIGRTLNLSMLGSYEELYRRLGAMFGMERSEMSSNVVYSDARGETKNMGDELFR